MNLTFYMPFQNIFQTTYVQIKTALNMHQGSLGKLIEKALCSSKSKIKPGTFFQKNSTGMNCRFLFRKRGYVNQNGDSLDKRVLLMKQNNLFVAYLTLA